MEKKRKKNNYVDNEKLYEELTKYVKEYDEAVVNKAPLPMVPSYIGKSILDIARNLANKHSFRSYTYVDEMISDGVENCLLYLHKFNYKEYSKPFAYLTQIIYFAFLRRIGKEQRQQYTKMKSMKNSYIMNTLATMSAEDMKYIENSDMSYFDEEKFAALAEKFEKKTPANPKSKKGVELLADD